MQDFREQLVDELLVMDCQDGSRQAMERLVSRWQKRLWRYALRLTGDPQAAWDVTQDSWLAIVRGIARLHDPARFAPWAYRIVTNKANDWIGRNVRTRRLPPDFDRQAEQSEEPPAAIDAADLQSVLPRLSDAGRTVLTLHYLEGFGLSDIAEILHVPQGTVKSRLHAARNELKSLWLGTAGLKETENE
jgi:RNA polymerase sigma-70 factor (ECF subfamily)